MESEVLVLRLSLACRAELEEWQECRVHQAALVEAAFPVQAEALDQPVLSGQDLELVSQAWAQPAAYPGPVLEQAWAQPAAYPALVLEQAALPQQAQVQAH